MAKYRKLGRTSSQRKALLRTQVTALLYHGKIVTTEARAKEIRKIAEGIIAMGVREKDNYETVKVTAKVARKDKDGKRVKEVVDGKKVTVYDEVEKEIKKDLPSRLHARRQMLKVLYPVTEVPEKIAGRKKGTKKVDMPAKIFIISDMEFDYCTEDCSLTNFEYTQRLFEEHGYQLPEVMFWNVASRNQQQPVKINDQGVALVSGCNPRIFSMLKAGILSPYAFMMDVLGSERYAAIVA